MDATATRTFEEVINDLTESSWGYKNQKVKSVLNVKVAEVSYSEQYNEWSVCGEWYKAKKHGTIQDVRAWVNVKKTSDKMKRDLNGVNFVVTM